MDEQQLINKLPKSLPWIRVYQPANSFYHLLLQGADPYAVIDEMLVYYSRVVKEYDERLTKAVEQGFNPLV